MITVKGRIEGVQEWANALMGLRDATALGAELAKRLTAPFRAAHKASWDAGQSPYGAAWGTPLYRTGALRAAATAWRAHGTSLVTGAPPRYARFVAARYVFEPSRGLPGPWGEILQREADRLVRDRLPKS